LYLGTDTKGVAVPNDAIEFRLPTGEELTDLASQFGWRLDGRDHDEILEALRGLNSSYERLDELSKDVPGLEPDRDGGFPATDPAWAWQCYIEGASTGPLAGMRVAVKDSIAVAGLPTRMGSDLLAHSDTRHIARQDAEVVTRLLDAGATVVGKSTTEDLCIGGSSCTSKPHPIENPYEPGKSAGGSSSGSAVLVARGDVDIALGADQGGSIRIPAALCGIVGLKPTFGLIPFTGIQGIVWSLDHVGPMARTVTEVARALDVLAGPDSWDRRGHGLGRSNAVAELSRDPRGLRVGLLTEGFHLTAAGESDFTGSRDAAELVQTTAEQLRGVGMHVTEISIPWHMDARHIYGPLLLEAAVVNLWRSFGQASTDHSWPGDTPAREIIRSLKDHPTDASLPTRLVAIAGSWHLMTQQGQTLEKASALVSSLRAAYNTALSDFDVLVHPTTAPAGIPGPLLSPHTSVITESLSYFHNTCATNLTGHPSVSVPVGSVTQGPVGMHITGRHAEDALVLRVAAAVEAIVSR
jgi:amidase